MSSNICGNCENFKPKKGEGFFNCTAAKHAGVRYGMQVRVDSQACDAFAPFRGPEQAAPKTVAKPIVKQTRMPRAEGSARPTGLCPWGRLIIISVLVIAIILLSVTFVTCLNSSSTTEPNTLPTQSGTTQSGGASQTPVGTSSSGWIIETRAPTPTPIPYLELSVGEWARTSMASVAVGVATKSLSRPLLRGQGFAPPGTFFVAVNVTIVNTSQSKFWVGEKYWTIVDSVGGQYKGESLKQSYGLMYDLQLAPGSTVNDTLYFNLPNIATDLKVYYPVPGGGWARWTLPF